QQFSQITPGAAHADIEMPELRIHRADFTETHLVDQLFERQRIVGKQVHAPLPIVETDRSSYDLLYLTRVAPPDECMLMHLPCALFNRQRVPILVLSPPSVHGIEANVPGLWNFRKQ